GGFGGALDHPERFPAFGVQAVALFPSVQGVLVHGVLLRRWRDESSFVCAFRHLTNDVFRGWAGPRRRAGRVNAQTFNEGGMAIFPPTVGPTMSAPGASRVRVAGRRLPSRTRRMMPGRIRLGGGARSPATSLKARATAGSRRAATWTLLRYQLMKRTAAVRSPSTSGKRRSLPTAICQGVSMVLAARR